MQAPPILKETIPVNPRQHVQPRAHPLIIPIEENFEYSDSEAEEQHHYRQQRGRHHGPKTPLSEELEEIQWPRQFNPTVLPQFNGESDPKESLLKYEATIQAAGRGTTGKAKALILALRGPAQRWYTNLPFGSVLSWNQLRKELVQASEL